MDSSSGWLPSSIATTVKFCAHRIQRVLCGRNEKARFDQQPVEACATISACLEVYRLTEEDYGLKRRKRVFRWFLGKNDLQAPLYDASTGGCRDGFILTASTKPGAESTLSFLMALLESASQSIKRTGRHLEMSSSLE